MDNNTWLVNVVGSTIAREVDAGTYIHAGTQIELCLQKHLHAVDVAYSLTMMIAKEKGTISDEKS